MKRTIVWLAGATALAGCGNLLGIQVLDYDGGETVEGGVDATGDSPGTHDATQDAPKSDGPTADASTDADGATVGDTSASDTSPTGDTGAGGDTGGADTSLPDTGPPADGGCTAGDKGCSGNAPWSCVDGGVVTAAACSNQTCVAGACVGVCAPGQTQCTSGNAAYQTCKSDGTWGTTATCAAPIGGSPTCTPGTGCGAGACTNSSLPNLCSGTCVNFTNDAYNCGLCGQTCTGSTCSTGHCVPQAMCDGSGNDAGAVNTGNAARVALAPGVIPPLQKVEFAYYELASSVWGCPLVTSAPSPAAFPTIVIPRVGGICTENYGDVASDKSNAYSIATAGVDCHGTALHDVPANDNLGSPAAGPLVGDAAGTQALYSLASPVMQLVTFAVVDGGTVASSTPCITVSGTLGDGAAGGGFAVAVDTAGGVLLGATNTGGACSASKVLASNQTAETAVAVAQNGTTFAFQNGANLYVCASSGCTGAELSTPYAANVGTILRGGLVFDGSSPPNLYWVGSGGLERCAGVTPGGTCTPTVLVPGVAATSGIGVDATYVYYQQGLVTYRAAK